MTPPDLSTLQTVLWWSGIVVIYAATLALVYRSGRIDGRRQGERRVASMVLIKHLCATLSCDGYELAVIIKAARKNVGQVSTGNTDDDLVWGALHIGLLQAEKERMR